MEKSANIQKIYIPCGNRNWDDHGSWKPNKRFGFTDKQAAETYVANNSSFDEELMEIEVFSTVDEADARDLKEIRNNALGKLSPQEIEAIRKLGVGA